VTPVAKEGRETHLLSLIYDKLNRHFGDLHWWPARTAFEVIIGAILTQNTAWRNVERALENLRDLSLLDPRSMDELDSHLLEALIRPSGTYRVKTARIKNFMRFLRNSYDGNLEEMFREELWPLREKMLGIKGIGKETADSILLYAGQKPVFVIDAYTRRILSRHGVTAAGASYDDLQNYFMNNLPAEVPLYNQFHALLVNVGKVYCRTLPRCGECPLQSIGP